MSLFLKYRFMKKLKGVGPVKADFGLKCQVHLTKDFGHFLNTLVSISVDSISLCDRFKLIYSLKTLRFKLKFEKLIKYAKKMSLFRWFLSKTKLPHPCSSSTFIYVMYYHQIQLSFQN